MGDAQADGHDAFFNTEDDKSVAELYLSPWTHSEFRDLLIIPLLAVSFLWTCGVLYLLLARRFSPFNTMWPSRALLVVVAFCWQASFAITTGRAQMTAFGISSQDQCRIFIFADFAVFEPWFCLILVFSLNIRWPTCITSVLRLCACCQSPSCGMRLRLGKKESMELRQDSRGVTDAHSEQEAESGQDALMVHVDVDRQGSGASGSEWRGRAERQRLAHDSSRTRAGEALDDDAAPNLETGGGDGGHGGREGGGVGGAGSGASARRPAAALMTIEKEGGAGGFYYLTPSVSIIASIVLLTPSIFFHVAWYRVVVLGKEWPPMRLQVGAPCATWFGHLLGTAVYLALTILMLHVNGRTLAALAINRRVRRRLLWLRVRLSMLLITSFLLRFITVFYKDLSSSTSNALFLAYFGVVVITCNLSIYSLIVRPLMGNLKPWAWAGSHVHSE